MLHNMTTLVAELPDAGVTFEIGPAFVDLNPLFAAASEALIRPYVVAIQLERISEEKQLDLLARVYAESVIIESKPEMDRPALYKWLLDHQAEFEALREYAEHRPNFVDEDEDGEGQEVQGA